MTIYLPELIPSHSTVFPNIENALNNPDGLLIMGGDLSSAQLISAYQHGIFPWYSDGDPILWWSPSVRGVFFPEQFSPSKSLKKFFRKSNYNVTLNKATYQVIDLCASTRPKEETWIMPEMIKAYKTLVDLGYCHSVEVWNDNELIGGLYGLQIGQVFCGESMFSLQTNASKIALWKFCEHFVSSNGKLIDCQMMNPHLESLGAQEMKRSNFKTLLEELRVKPTSSDCYLTQTLGDSSFS
ncbi:leucyl/phenylalanyl-tRNA--protein transferase [Aliivibrio fischeri]|uniref:leucyl/phenylalanyl-tRNA--protein transferase n=1 Tax=Aliivibrio fischeri TaxID=668 RepID=UPI0012D8BD68|nr:leucyl/phenylalanyl-tRNA--protein transferase [Aliivibrio fischeri]MUK68596.1 leucyl/phenylalanyl-tRNA--protein transferase [Aliivibrio fischeri]MUK73104.1 leucyl/phenylalanyl-tRNA--protein transferase [Aliivibrio fischeri]MUK76011.1 leucyl/phenylalanyl-tRNA--protein transferase [Aliivibrio fischeri]